MGQDSTVRSNPHARDLQADSRLAKATQVEPGGFMHLGVEIAQNGEQERYRSFYHLCRIESPFGHVE